MDVFRSSLMPAKEADAVMKGYHVLDQVTFEALGSY